MSWLPWFAVIATIGAVIVHEVCYRLKGVRFPPGPKPLPFIGNVLDMPRKHLGRDFTNLVKRYGALSSPAIPHCRANNHNR